MGSIVMYGGGVIGLSAAVMLARDGHRVTVLEADEQSPPAAAAVAWERWQRRRVAQFRQPHNVFPRFRQFCDEELAELPGRLAAAGCPWVDPLGSPALGEMLPPSLSDREPRPADDAFQCITGRRPDNNSPWGVQPTLRLQSAGGCRPGEVRRGQAVR